MTTVLRGSRLLECVTPVTRILKTDLTWVRADQIELGDELLAFDKTINGITGTGKGRGHAHKFQPSAVTGLSRFIRPRIRVTTTHGTVVVAANHPFVARSDKQERRWILAKDLRPDMRMAFLAEPWEVDQSREGGYLAGFFDGEGWIGRVNVGYGQNPGPTLTYVQRLLTERGFEFRVSQGSSTAQCEITNGIRPTLRFLGSIRPPRLLRKARQIWEGRRTWGKQSPVCRVLGIEHLPLGPVIAIATTSQTYISEGFFSHNCDFSGIEAVLTGYFMRDPSYIRLAKLGVHAALASHILKRPYNPTWPDAQLAEYFQGIKKSEDATYQRAKRCVHGVSYGLTEYGMVRNFPETFPTLKVAKALIAHYHQMAPLLPKWQGQVRERAYAQNYLGGPGDHPFGYKHWFWAVLGFRPITHALYQQRIRRHQPVTVIQGKYFALVWGDDSKRAVAFYPQSTAAGVLKEVMLRLFDPENPSYIGDAYFGRTPFRAPIHDSLLLEVPVRVWDHVLEKVYLEMLRPVPELPLGWIEEGERKRLGLGTYLSIGVEAKAGMNWLEMEKLPTPSLQELGVSMDGVYLPAMDEDEEDEVSLGTVA